MKKFDHNGLLLAEYQGKLFEKSFDLECSTGVFFRRFIHSELLKKLDANNPVTVSLDIQEGIKSLENQFGKSEYGVIKYSQGSLFWIGYMYRYISYTREQSTKFISQLFDYRLLNSVYYTYHTQDPEWCISSLLELKNLTEEVFDNNVRLKQTIKKSKSLKLVCPT